MKLILREYLASLREREELDAILPDLLSELGYTVFSRPGRGTAQHGVDIAAVSPTVRGKRKLYLFTVKKGDLSRTDWSGGSAQALRPSLDDILDVYIPTKIPPEYASLPVVICIVVGGEIKETARAGLSGYTRKHTKRGLSFEEWNGDKLAGFLLDGVLREDLLPKPFRSNFQKAVALLDEPDVAYRHFSLLARQLVSEGVATPTQRIRAARQLYICVWVMFVWGRDVENLEAPYQASELALLGIWELLKPLIGSAGEENAAMTRVLQQMVQVHTTIGAEFMAQRVMPYAKVQDGLSTAVQSRTSADVNLKLLDLLGRLGLMGLWIEWGLQQADGANAAERKAAMRLVADTGLDIIENNQALVLPLCDQDATSVALFLLLCLWSEISPQRVVAWLNAMAHRLDFTIRTHGRYPTVSTDYRVLISHPRSREKDYFEEATAGSTLIPLLAAWLAAFGQSKTVGDLAGLVAEHLEHCTMQLWSPDADSETHLYLNDELHGRSLTDLPIDETGQKLLETIKAGCDHTKGLEKLSAMQTGYWPLILVACRHWRYPVPPDFWIEATGVSGPGSDDAAPNDAPD